ncbi:hypothetical protein RYX36_010327, partial [Vicia faba]
MRPQQGFLQSDKKTIACVKRFCFLCQSGLPENVKLLLDNGVSHSNIARLFHWWPSIICSFDLLHTVEELKELGFDGSTSAFSKAFLAKRSATKAQWDEKVETFKKWGLSDEQILETFKKHPFCMLVSPRKINAIMDFWVHHLGLDSLDLARAPGILQCSLEKWIIPRASVVQFLISKGLRRKDAGVYTPFVVSEKLFVEKFVKGFEEHSSDLIKLYEEKLNLADGRNDIQLLLLGIRRANRPQTVMPSSVLSSDSMHIGLLAAAAHAAATNSCFTVFYNPRASPSEFVIPLSKYIKAVYHTRISVGMRFRMLFETEESSVRRYMGTITGISDLDAVRWPSSHWRSVGWDESTAGERQTRVSLWEIEPLTTFPMYPSLFPLRLKRPWHPGTSSLLGTFFSIIQSVQLDLHISYESSGPADQGLNSLNFQGAGGMLPWMQQRLDPTLLGNDHNQQYQAMLAAAGMQNMGSGYLMRPQMMNFQQQPIQYLQSGNNNSPLQLQQPHAIPQSVSSNMMQPQGQVLTENLSQHLLQKTNNNQEVQGQQQQHGYQDTLLIQNDQLHQRQQQQSNAPSPSYTKQDFLDSNLKFPASASSGQNMLGSLCNEGTGNLLNLSSLSRSGQSLMTEQLPQQSWTQKYGNMQVNAFSNTMSHAQFSGKDLAVVPHCDSDTQNHTLSGVNIDSSGLLLPTTVQGYTTSSADTGASTMQLGESGFQSSLYACMQDSSSFLQNAEQSDPQNQNPTFVKVYKSGSVGRSLDISRFNSYRELREEL